MCMNAYWCVGCEKVGHMECSVSSHRPWRARWASIAFVTASHPNVVLKAGCSRNSEVLNTFRLTKLHKSNKLFAANAMERAKNTYCLKICTYFNNLSDGRLSQCFNTGSWQIWAIEWNNSSDNFYFWAWSWFPFPYRWPSFCAAGTCMAKVPH